ncbi:hypothetical protein AMTR_s00033p00194410 [Amborella trichopoda]|uniref:Isopenicillin N synthase-like Fe(2+) 2OG dioxygenase domain-containing protein n=1 Tax=Amborella trichopoda TaxID=13333 RepID=U5CW07_AMBTC|nr:hypothetical protein AMTR_s00033p00194410 [Amborella trichopoda]
MRPRCMLVSTQSDKVLGLKAHSDSSGITILMQDPHTQGLQVLKDETWHQIPALPHGLLVNIGDHLEVGKHCITLMVLC